MPLAEAVITCSDFRLLPLLFLAKVRKNIELLRLSLVSCLYVVHLLLLYQNYYYYRITSSNTSSECLYIRASTIA